MFTDMKDKINKSSDFKNQVKFVGRCEKLLETGQSYIKGNDIAGKSRVLGASAPKKAVEVRKALFKYFVDIRSALKERLPNTVNSNENRKWNLRS